MSSGTNKERIIQNNELIQNNNNKLNVLANKVNTLSGTTQAEIEQLNEIADNILGDTNPYEFVNCILGYAGSGTINTGVKASSKIKVQVKLRTYMKHQSAVIGWHNTSESKALKFFNPSGVAMLDYGSGYGKNRIQGGDFAPNVTYSFEFGNRYIKNLDTGKILAENTTVADFAYEETLQIMECYIWWFKIFEDDVLVRDYIPARNRIDGSIGLWDKISNSFTKAQGTWTVENM